MESTDLIPMEADVAKITKRAEEFKDLPDALQRNLQTFLALIMDIIAAVHRKIKNSSLPEAQRQMVCVLYALHLMRVRRKLIAQRTEQTIASPRTKSRALIIFAGNLKYRMSPDVYSYLARLDVEIAL